MTRERPSTMPEPHEDTDPQHAQVDEIVSRGPTGAFAVAGIATAIVVAIYFAFYVFIYLPRGAVQ
jgi:phosphatidylglycerophosphatase A